ncbi:Cytoplasmic tRNA 2-thiolation protein 2 [Psilocybe cubensis]|uniref:Cytoplasmic tRNA 2-thiolation protein 2 n=2 Tax=Psilocybe cubensis TaxID=181762 RepID=A0ACB8H1Q2_PSICU|nr:Cytoplasmic tRNA 2-thiolation protein 2 [Psilocybe cubensis]KAH9481406.1 Cytoplasmic tRNA 2-thiolation protein 2 [Psilocybe cubensis]
MSSCENPNVDKDALMTRRQKFDGKTKICVKCKENRGNIVVRYAVYCKTCFFPLVQGRFRKSLEPTINAPNGTRRKGLKASGSLVVGISGGTSSVAMLDLVAKTYFAPLEADFKGGMEHPRLVDKSVWKGKPYVCYVEVCGAFPGERDRIEEVRHLVESYADAEFEFIPLRLEDSFDKKWWDTFGGSDLSNSARSLGLDMRDEDLRLATSSSEISSLTAMRTYLSSLPTPTAFHSAVQILIRLLLLHTAASRRASHLLLGTSLTALSVNLISGIAQGAGFSVAEEAQEVWDPPNSGDALPIRIVRPMREIGMKECAIWDWWCKLNIVAHSRTSPSGVKNAISALTKDFIYGLESDYPATVSTIARTCAKLTPKEGSNGTCILCGRPAQSGVQEWKSRISIRSYQEARSAVSGNTRPSHLTEDEITNLTKTSTLGSTPTVPSLTPQLCYACHTLLTSRSSRATIASLPPGQSLDNIPLPLWVQSTIEKLRQQEREQEHAEHDSHPDLAQGVKLSRSEMREQIAEFLLPEE